MKSAILAATLGSMIALPALAQEWYEGGTLHQANGNGWQEASQRDRIATSADFVARMSDMPQSTISVDSMDELRLYAAELATCVTEATSTSAANSLEVSEVAVSCAVIMNWVR